MIDNINLKSRHFFHKVLYKAKWSLLIVLITAGTQWSCSDDEEPGVDPPQDDCCASVEQDNRHVYKHLEITGLFSRDPCENYLGLLDGCKPMGKVSYLYADKVMYDQYDKIVKEAVFECFDCDIEQENIIDKLEQFKLFHESCEERDWVLMDSMIRVNYGPENDGVTFTTFYQKWERGQ